MTSKESLEMYHRVANNIAIIPDDTKHYETIKKDLEVLEIIKEHKLLNYVIKNKKCANMYHLSTNEIKDLKEWLENE